MPSCSVRECVHATSTHADVTLRVKNPVSASCNQIRNTSTCCNDGSGGVEANDERASLRPPSLQLGKRSIREWISLNLWTDVRDISILSSFSFLLTYNLLLRAASRDRDPSSAPIRFTPNAYRSTHVISTAPWSWSWSSRPNPFSINLHRQLSPRPSIADGHQRAFFESSIHRTRRYSYLWP